MIVGNWKMHASSLDTQNRLQALRSQTFHIPVAICLPFPYLAQAKTLLERSGIAWGAQNMSLYAEGAHTGEVSVHMLTDFACSYVLLGHSECRQMGENNAQIAAKVKLACQTSIRPILCLGETLDECTAGYTTSVLQQQLQAALNVLPRENWTQLILAYEPVWAIGHTATADAKDAQKSCAYLRSIIAEADPAVAQNIRILYGGSVQSDNAETLLNMPDINGLLVGRASLNPDIFTSIIRRSEHALMDPSSPESTQ